ncbi:MAG: motility protein A [Clostridiales bacterium]|nr:motility protein A [Clostridiales bacterium]
MDMMTAGGLLWGAFCVIVSILLSGDLGMYFDIPSIFIVFGGVMSATMVSYPLSTLKTLPQLIGNAFRAKQIDYGEDIEMIINIANIARREGILALEESVDSTGDPFLKKGLMLIVDGSDPELVRNIMETELAFISERHSNGQAVLLSMSSFSPAFGMAGTLIGLINMLQTLEDMDSLGPNMAVALVTTFYGVLLANLVFTPMATKLRVQSNGEYLRKEMILEGILSIQDGENPRIIREKLSAFLSNAQLRRREVETPQKETQYAEDA